MKKILLSLTIVAGAALTSFGQTYNSYHSEPLINTNGLYIAGGAVGGTTGGAEVFLNATNYAFNQSGTAIGVPHGGGVWQANLGTQAPFATTFAGGTLFSLIYQEVQGTSFTNGPYVGTNSFGTAYTNYYTNTYYLPGVYTNYFYTNTVYAVTNSPIGQTANLIGYYNVVPDDWALTHGWQAATNTTFTVTNSLLAGSSNAVLYATAWLSGTNYLNAKYGRLVGYSFAGTNGVGAYLFAHRVGYWNLPGSE